MTFGFHASFVHVDDVCRRLACAERNDAAGTHDVDMDRSEESPDEGVPDLSVPDLSGAYIERDDQAWGGYGGISRVVLTRDSLTLYLAERRAIRMGGSDSLRVSFEVPDAVFGEVRHVLGLIMRGYESRLEAPEAHRRS